MAPARKTTRNRKVDLNKQAKLAAFLEDFDSEVLTRLGQMEERLKQLLKDIDIVFEMEALKLPRAVRVMNWLHWWNEPKPKIVEEPDAKQKAETAAIIESVAAEDHAAMLKSLKKSTRKRRTAADENAAPATQRKTRARPPVSKKTKTLTANKRNSHLKTPSSNLLNGKNMMDSSMMGPTPLFTPRFDSRLLKTPAFRVPRHKERVYSISVNGSPIESANEDIVINIPVGNGERMQLLASQIQSGDLSNLDETALRSIKQLKSRLATLC
ncbi:borealin isoform 1-T1 [Synchiropus picturatus]